MSVCVIKGNPKWPHGIPKNSRVRVELLPGGTAVFDQKCTKQAVVDLEPGLYAVVISKYLGVNANKRHSVLHWESKFLHELTQKQYEVLSSMSLSGFTGRQTSEGFILYCQICDFSCMSHMSAMIHNFEHKGVSLDDVVNNSDYAMAMMDEPVVAEQPSTSENIDLPPGMPSESPSLPKKPRRSVIPAG